jgi:hypothetical protein
MSNSLPKLSHAMFAQRKCLAVMRAVRDDSRAILSMSWASAQIRADFGFIFRENRASFSLDEMWDRSGIASTLGELAQPAEQAQKKSHSSVSCR